MPGGEAVRQAQQVAWAGLSAGWEKWDAVIMAQLGPVSAAMIERLGVAPGQRHLDIAAGTGEPGLSIARAAPGGRVVLADLSVHMLAVARRRAAVQGVDAELAVCSADGLPFADGTFDSVSVRFGYMFFPDLVRATAELARVLRPGGRLCASVWAAAERNPWTTIATRAVAAEVVLPPPDPQGPHMFRCAEPGHLPSLYVAAGLRDVGEWDVAVELVTRSPEEYWEMTSEHVSLVAAALRQLDGPARQRVAQAVMAEVAAYQVDGAVRVPGLARCAVGTR